MADRLRAGGYYEAAVSVLEQVGEPLTTRELTEEALKRGLIRPRGKTPEATMSATLYTRILDDPGSRIERLHIQGMSRAQRGSVRWSLRRS